jgi:hypothetical protein
LPLKARETTPWSCWILVSAGHANTKLRGSSGRLARLDAQIHGGAGATAAAHGHVTAGVLRLDQAQLCHPSLPALRDVGWDYLNGVNDRHGVACRIG